MDDPRIKEIEMYGYPESMLKNYVGVDFFNNELYKGDEVFEYDHERFLIDELSNDFKEYLEHVNARKTTL